MCDFLLEEGAKATFTTVGAYRAALRLLGSISGPLLKSAIVWSVQQFWACSSAALQALTIRYICFRHYVAPLAESSSCASLLAFCGSSYGLFVLSLSFILLPTFVVWRCFLRLSADNNPTFWVVDLEYFGGVETAGAAVHRKQKSNSSCQVNQLDSEHQTALMWAAAMGYTGTCLFLNLNTTTLVQLL